MAIMLPDYVAKVVLSVIFLGFMQCAKNTRVSTLRTSGPMKRFTEALYNIYLKKSLPIDLSQMNNFDGSEYLVSITNFMNSDIVGAFQPFVIRKPIPALFKLENETDQFMFLGWILEGPCVSPPDEMNLAWYAHKVSSERCFSHGSCATLDFKRLILNSKLFNYQLRVDVYPPDLAASLIKKRINRLDEYYDEWLLDRWDFGYPFLWENNIGSSHIKHVLKGETPVLHFLLVPPTTFKIADDYQIIQAWSTHSEHFETFSTSNVQYFMVDLIQICGQKYSPGKIHYIDQQNKNVLIETALKHLDPLIIQTFLNPAWTRQMFWKSGHTRLNKSDGISKFVVSKRSEG